MKTQHSATPQTQPNGLAIVSTQIRGRFDRPLRSSKFPGNMMMNLFLAPSLKLGLVLGTTLLFLGCRAQSTKAGQETAATTAPGLTNALTNANPAQIAATNAAPQTPNTFGEKLLAGEIKLSPGLQEVIDMAERGVGDDILIAYIENSPFNYRLTAEEILYLTDLGFSEAVIAALIKHGKAPQNVAEKTGNGATNAVAPPPATVQSAAVVTTAPSVSITATPEFEAGVQPPPVTYVTPPPQVEYNYFYSSLAPYGSWVDLPDYGYCWQPTVAVIDPYWRPYCHRGRWLYTDCGWYWHSDYSWGWAPFHYGRWHSHPRRGWVWMPDTTWGPAWVTWRNTDAHCGWAPLPPGARFRHGFGISYFDSNVGISFDFGLRRDCYTFVPKSRFCDRAPWRHSLASADVVQIYNKSTVVNNYVSGSNNTVINEGVGRDNIARFTRSEIRKVEIRDMPASEARRTIRSERLDKNGTELAVFRPQIPNAPERSTTRANAELRSVQRPTGNGIPAESSAAKVTSIGSAAPMQTLRPRENGGNVRSTDRTIPSHRTEQNLAGPTPSVSPSGNVAQPGRIRSINSTPIAGFPAANRSARTDSPPVSISPALQAGAVVNPVTPPPITGGIAEAPQTRTETTSQRPKSAQEVRSTPSTPPPLVQTPFNANPNQRRERPQPIATSSTPIPSTPAPVIPAPSVPVAESARSPLSRRSIETRSFTPAANGSTAQPQSQGPTIRSRGFEQPNGFSSRPERSRSATITPIAPPVSQPAPSYTPPSFQPSPVPSSRQELQKPVTIVPPERQRFERSSGYQSQSGSSASYGAPSYQSSPSRNVGSLPPQYTPVPPRQSAAPSIQSRPSVGAPSSPPVQIQSRQVSPSVNSSPSQPSSRSSSGGGGRRQEANR